MLEIIAAMRENPALAEQARSVLLSRDLLELPAVVASLAQAQARTEQRLEELAQAQARTEQRLEELAQAQARTEQRLEELAQAMAVLAQRVASNTDTVGELKGKLLEDSLRAHPSRMGLRRLLRQPRLVEREELEDWLEEAGVDLGQLAPVANPCLADLVLDGVDPADGGRSILVVEVSWKVDAYDVDRAQARAMTLGHFAPRTRAAVAGRLIDQHGSDAARSAGVDTLISPGL